MKNESVKGVLQLLFSVAIYYLFTNYFFYFLSKVGINFEGDMYNYVSFGRYVLMCILIYLIYRSNIHGSKSKYSKTFITSAIFSIGSFVLLVFVNFLLHKFIGSFHEVSGYGFVDYFNDPFSISYLLRLIIDIVLKPFLIIVIFSLGTSNIVKKISSASIVSGLLYGGVLMLGYSNPIDVSFWLVLIPSIVLMLVTYLYKTTNNIWMIYIAYVLYVGFGTYVLRYFV